MRKLAHGNNVSTRKPNQMQSKKWKQLTVGADVGGVVTSVGPELVLGALVVSSEGDVDGSML